ncbi:unnamed protein product [Thlaspi arvense]|uniref:Bifunctional inhibitor/plant lipid transfer protein/seed storage helical domain-containing protein n=1 Tax=Thlaspi arvense TaxID=13288 RepID=A0AAU9R9T3_THLAR|nr:unnamed protein product [Thlaspi arvense]
MKFTTLILITFVIIAISSSVPIRATAVEGFGEEENVCHLIRLLPCLPATYMGLPPSRGCCDRLKVQESCLCGYIKNQDYGITSPKSRSMLEECKIPYPNC